ncbi:PelD GGDEF domain-containing protein [Castellaniella sp. FW104-16D08]|uniref:PelD GGDEF domain-containing protein n=1 Tax=unclassified Castellaniella TaxID=2617606 RepID=UPI0033145035
MPATRKGWQPVLEVLIGMLGMFAFCAAVRPQDPLLLQFGFPWLGAYALVFALRYGALPGAFAGGLLLLAWWFLVGVPEQFPKEYFAGTFVVLILAGHFSDRWVSRIQSENSVNIYLNRRLASLTNTHYLLRISHDRLEKDLLSRPVTMRDVLARLRNEVTPVPTGTGLPHVQAFLDYLASVAQVNEAAIFQVQGTNISQKICASVGPDFILKRDDALLKECIALRKLVHLRDQKEYQSDYLVCVPLETALGDLLGVLVIRRMFFMSLNFDTLQLIQAMAVYYADSLQDQKLIRFVQQRVPGCPDDFALEICRLGHLASRHGPVSHLVALAFNREGPDQSSVFMQMARQRRALDMVWVLETPRARVMVTLLVLADDLGLDGYVLRIEDTLRAQFGLDFESARVAVYSQAIDDADVATTLEQFASHWEIS